MIFMIGGTVLGIILGILIVMFVPKNVLGRVVLGLGAVALIFFVPILFAIVNETDTSSTSLATIPLGLSCLISGVFAIRNSLRSWQVWLGLSLGAIPILFWIAFGIGEILYPH